MSKVHVSISRTNDFQTWTEIECKIFLLSKCEYAKCQLPSKQSRGKSANKAQMLLLSSCQSAKKWREPSVSLKIKCGCTCQKLHINF